MIDGGSPLPGWERGPLGQPAPAHKDELWQPAAQAAWAAWAVQAAWPQGQGSPTGKRPRAHAEHFGSPPGPAASARHPTQDTHGHLCATGSPVPTAPARLGAKHRPPALSLGQPCVSGGRQLGPSPAMAKEAQPCRCWPQPLLRHQQGGRMWGPSPRARGPGGAAGGAGRGWRQLSEGC